MANVTAFILEISYTALAHRVDSRLGQGSLPMRQATTDESHSSRYWPSVNVEVRHIIIVLDNCDQGLEGYCEEQLSEWVPCRSGTVCPQRGVGT